MERQRRGDMTVTLARLLTELDIHGRGAVYATKCVIAASGTIFQMKSILGAYDRGLVKVTYENTGKARKNQWVELTELGQFAAEGLKARRTSENQPVSEAAALMITEALAPT